MRRDSGNSRAVAIGGGVSVLVATGLAGFWEFTRPGATAAYQIAGVALLVILLVCAWLLARFVSRHGDEIGEARFDTTSKTRLNGKVDQ